MKTTEELNELLAKAKTSQAFWDEWENAGAWDRDDFWKKLHRSNAAAWSALYQGLRDSAPLILVSPSGQHEIGTVGVLTSTEMMYFAKEQNSKWTFQGVSLRSVTEVLVN